MRKLHELAVVTRTYTQNGQDKKHWQNVGAIYQTDDGHLRVRLDAFFNFSALRQDNSDRVWLTAFTPKPKEQQQNNSYSSYDETHGFDSNTSLDSDVPF